MTITTSLAFAKPLSRTRDLGAFLCDFRISGAVFNCAVKGAGTIED